LPKIIVIGCENSGKSSLLENILKCNIFPRNYTLCTKLPIHIILKPVQNESDIKFIIKYLNTILNIDKKEDIIIHINNIMNKITKDDIDEITVEIYNLNIPSLEFIDLPGYSVYNDEISNKTLKLTEKYLEMPNTIVMCVIPAITIITSSYIPISMIIKYNKQPNTIICLTMCDRIQEENIYELLIKRIINESNEYSQNEFCRTIGVINRSHINTKTLDENDKFSEEWFNTNIIEKIPEDFPKDKIYLIKSNINITNLINNLNILYNKFISTTLVPNTLRKLLNIKTIVSDDILKLGVPIKDYDNKKQIEIFNYIIDYITDTYSTYLGPLLVNDNINIEFKNDYYIKLYDFTTFIHEIQFLSSSLLNTETIKIIINNKNHPYNENIYSYICNNNDIILLYNSTELGIINNISSIYDENLIKYSNTNYNISRFTKLITLIINNMYQLH